MRINKFVALATGMSRRSADAIIAAGHVRVGDNIARAGDDVDENTAVFLDNNQLAATSLITIALNKPASYICSREGQGGKTIYDLLPEGYHHLKSVGRLDKDSSGLLLLTNDGKLAQELTHPSFQKIKRYEVVLDRNLASSDRQAVEAGIMLDDGVSNMKIHGSGTDWLVAMSEGRNRQIRRTFGALGYEVTKLHRTQFGDYKLDALKLGAYRILSE